MAWVKPLNLKAGAHFLAAACLACSAESGKSGVGGRILSIFQGDTGSILQIMREREAMPRIFQLIFFGPGRWPV